MVENVEGREVQNSRVPFRRKPKQKETPVGAKSACQNTKYCFLTAIKQQANIKKPPNPTLFKSTFGSFARQKARGRNTESCSCEDGGPCVCQKPECVRPIVTPVRSPGQGHLSERPRDRQASGERGRKMLKHGMWKLLKGVPQTAGRKGKGKQQPI